MRCESRAPASSGGLRASGRSVGSTIELRAEDRSMQALGAHAHKGWRHDPTSPARARKESYVRMYLLGDRGVGRRARRAEGGL
jgi:hypothetical protein